MEDAGEKILSDKEIAVTIPTKTGLNFIWYLLEKVPYKQALPRLQPAASFLHRQASYKYMNPFVSQIQVHFEPCQVFLQSAEPLQVFRYRGRPEKRP
jgi:hypothetical protein